ncbi:MAG: hypothetical protein PF542_05510 [Nanoarchaeota archaeon]|jgi:hypothetical protein|nr:hypothetical protein [Nanoarchaeota archaeon]
MKNLFLIAVMLIGLSAAAQNNNKATLCLKDTIRMTVLHSDVRGDLLENFTIEVGTGLDINSNGKVSEVFTILNKKDKLSLIKISTSGEVFVLSRESLSELSAWLPKGCALESITKVNMDSNSEAKLIGFYEEKIGMFKESYEEVFVNLDADIQSALTDEEHQKDYHPNEHKNVLVGFSLENKSFNSGPLNLNFWLEEGSFFFNGGDMIDQKKSYFQLKEKTFHFMRIEGNGFNIFIKNSSHGWLGRVSLKKFQSLSTKYQSQAIVSFENCQLKSVTEELKLK